MSSYLVELVARTPQPSGPPSLETVGPIAFGQLSYELELSRDGEANLSTTVRQLDPDVRWHLADPWRRPCEIAVFRDRTLVWQGPVWHVGLQAGTVTIHARGLAAYLRGMIVGPDTGTLDYSQVDQHQIVKGLVDAWQQLPYGHFGLDTTAVGTSGRLRDRTYPAAELHNVYSRVINLTEVVDGFDFEVRPDRTVRCHHPRQGGVRDLFLDARNIGSADEHRGAADGRVCSVAYVNTSEQDAGLDIAKAEDPGALASYGRWGYAASRDGITDQTTLDGYAAAALEARRTLDWQPAPGIRPVRELPVDAVGLGDTLEYRFDAGLGERRDLVRIVKKQVQIGSEGGERLAIEVATDEGAAGV